MVFRENPQNCLEDAAGDLRMMGCVIFYKKCQELDTVTSQILIGVCVCVCVCVCVSGFRLQLGYCKCMRYQSLVPSG